MQHLVSFRMYLSIYMYFGLTLPKLFIICIGHVDIHIVPHNTHIPTSSTVYAQYMEVLEKKIFVCDVLVYQHAVMFPG